MISYFTIKALERDKANTNAAQEISIYYDLGYREFARQELFQNGQYCIVVWITPRNEE